MPSRKRPLSADPTAMHPVVADEGAGPDDPDEEEGEEEEATTPIDEASVPHAWEWLALERVATPLERSLPTMMGRLRRFG